MALRNISYIESIGQTLVTHFQQQNGMYKYSTTGRDQKKWLGVTCEDKVFLTIDGSDPLMDFLSDRSPCTQNAACFHRHQLQISYLHMH